MTVYARIWAISVLMALLLGLCCRVEQAQAQDKGIPTNITSKSVLFDQHTDIVTFTGDVVVVRQDMTITSDELKVYLVEQAGPKPQAAPTAQNATAGEQTPAPSKNIDHIVAIGNVHIEQLNREGFSHTATYRTKDNTVTMEGDPMLREKDTKNQITGDKIIFNMTTNKSQVFSSPDKRVEAVFYSSEDGQ